MSPMVLQVRCNTFSTSVGTTPTVKLKISGPFISRQCVPAGCVPAVPRPGQQDSEPDHDFAAPPFTIRLGAPRPSVPQTGASIYSSESGGMASIKVAAAPSPNNVRTLLSDSRMNLLYVSDVTSRIVSAWPVSIKPFAMPRPYTNPEQPRPISSAPDCVDMPRRSCTMHAVVGRK